jgi:hypothetical protein
MLRQTTTKPNRSYWHPAQASQPHRGRQPAARRVTTEATTTSPTSWKFRGLLTLTDALLQWATKRGPLTATPGRPPRCLRFSLPPRSNVAPQDEMRTADHLSGLDSVCSLSLCHLTRASPPPLGRDATCRRRQNTPQRQPQPRRDPGAATPRRSAPGWPRGGAQLRL